MPITAFSRWLPRRVAFLLGLLVLPVASGLAQVPQPAQPGTALPSPDQAKEMLQGQPALVEQLRQRISQSGLTPDQVRSRLRALGYPEDLLDQYIQGADTTALARPGPGTLDAVRALGILSPQEADSLGLSDSLFAQSDSVRHLLDSLRMVHLDSLRADSLSDSLERIRPTGLRIFGLTTFRKLSNQFDVPENGPVDENYRLGPGDVLVLIMTGDVERADMLEVTREGFVVIPQVGSIYVANVSIGQLEDQLYTRLGRVYSGVRRSPNARTKFQVSIARLRNVQVFVAGDVVRPGSYQISAAGTVLNALYAAGGPTTNGSFRRVELRRGGKLADSVDLYEYLTKGMNPTGARLQSGDVVFVPVHGGFAKVVGKVNRPAIYEMLPNETLRDAVDFAGGFDATAVHARITINRVVPSASRAPGAPTRVVVAVGSDQFTDGMAPALPMAPGDSVTVQGIEDRMRGFVTVRGNVWGEGQVGYTAGMKLSDAIRLAGGARPDLYLGRILVTRVSEDSTMTQFRSAFADSTGTVTDDLVLQDQDEIRIWSRSTFRSERWVAVVGAVRKPGRVPFRDGMTLRDAVLLADGLTPDAWLQEAEIARLDSNRVSGGALATAIRVPLDSTYVFGRTPGDRYAGPPGLPAPASGAPEAPLQPYDNVMIMRQTGWDLQRSVAVTGQVKFPGRYSLKSKTDRVSDLLERAGGLTDQAYTDGVQFYRRYTAGRPTGGDPISAVDSGVAIPIRGGRDTVTRSAPERIGIDLPRVLKDPKFRDNVVLIGGDSINIPEFDPVVLVNGFVNSPGPVAFEPGKNLDWYVDRAGGYGVSGDDDHSYVTQPNGERAGVKRRTILADRVPHPAPGAVVYVPRKLVQPQNNLGAVLGTVAQVLGILTTIIVVATR